MGSKGNEAYYLTKLRKLLGKMGPDVTAEKMKKCVWIRPEVVTQMEFLEWTDADRLRHSKFVGLRDDKDAGKVVKEKEADSNARPSRRLDLRPAWPSPRMLPSQALA